MKNIFILHSLNGDTLDMWGLDVKDNFKNIDVYMPKFPIRAESRYEKFKDILEVYLKDGILNSNSIIIGHSIGNAYFVRFCYEMNFVPSAYIAVAPGGVYEYPTTRTDYIVDVKKQAYASRESLAYVKNMTCKKYCLYSDEDDNNKEKFDRFINDTNSTAVYLKGYNHFDGYHRIYKIPELNELILSLVK